MSAFQSSLVAAALLVSPSLALMQPFWRTSIDLREKQHHTQPALVSALKLCWTEQLTLGR
jgi:hypothetical protein